MILVTEFDHEEIKLDPKDPLDIESIIVDKIVEKHRQFMGN